MADEPIPQNTDDQADDDATVKKKKKKKKEQKQSHLVRKADAIFGPVEATFETSGADVAAALDAELARFIEEGRTPTDYLAMMTDELAMGRACHGVVHEKGRVFSVTGPAKTKVGRKFRASIRTLASRAGKFRTMLRDHRGDEILVEIVFTQTIRPRHIDTITEVEYAITLYKTLDKSRFPLLEGMGEFDDETMVAFLEKLVADCKALKKEYELAVKANDKARQALKDAYADFRRIFGNVVLSFEAHFRMAGFNEQADKLRYLVSRTSRDARPQTQDTPDDAPPPATDDTPPPATDDGSTASDPPPAAP